MVDRKPEQGKVEPSARGKADMVATFVAKMAERKVLGGKRQKMISRKAKAILERNKSASPTPIRKRSRKRSQKKDTSTPSPVRRKKTRRSSPAFKVGDKVSAQWLGELNRGQWFPGSIVSINNRKKTIQYTLSSTTAMKTILSRGTVL